MLFDKNEAARAAIISIILMAAVAVAVFFLPRTYAFGRHKPEHALNSPAVQEWYRTRRNKLGQLCCNDADGHEYYGGYTMNADGSVTLDDGTILPAYMVLDGPNPKGSAVWWYLDGPPRKDYCFAPGSGS